MKKIAILLVILIPIFGTAQKTGCISGNCNNGYGTFVTEDGNKFVGNWKNGKKVKGAFYYSKGGTYNGECNDNVRNGRGKYTWKDGKYYVGFWRNGKRNGKGTQYHSNGKIEYDGLWENNKRVERKTYAVVVGVSDYKYNQSITDLTWCDEDANLFYKFLTIQEGIPDKNISLLLDHQATKSNILSSMKSTFSKANKNDYIIFYFSGHGNTGYFCPADINGYDNKLYHNDIKSSFKSSKANSKLCVVDACMSGSIRDKNDKLEDIDKSIKKSFDKDESIVVITASRRSETSVESSEVQQGIFSYYLIKGLKGAADLNKDREIYADELYSFLKDKVTSRNNQQHPVIFGTNIKSLLVGTTR